MLSEPTVTEIVLSNKRKIKKQLKDKKEKEQANDDDKNIMNAA